MKLRKNGRKTAEATIETAAPEVATSQSSVEAAKAAPAVSVEPEPAKAAPPKRTRAATSAKTDDVTNGALYNADPEHRRALIAEAAYFRAAQRGFTNGSPENDWLEAEAEVEAKLAKTDR